MARSDPHAASAEDALELLSDDQDAILELFDRYDTLASDGAPPGERRSLAEEICSLVAVHVEIKREILYRLLHRQPVPQPAGSEGELLAIP